MNEWLVKAEQLRVEYGAQESPPVADDAGSEVEEKWCGLTCLSKPKDSLSGRAADCRQLQGAGGVSGEGNDDGYFNFDEPSCAACYPCQHRIRFSISKKLSIMQILHKRQTKREVRSTHYSNKRK